MSPVAEVNLNKNTLVYRSMPLSDYADVFQLSSREFINVPSPRDCMVAFFKSFPWFFRVLLGIRERIGKMVGLKTANDVPEEEREDYLKNFKGEVGESIAVFEVLDKNDQELVTGQKDKHLDFKLSFRSYKDGSETKVELITLVKFNNFWGKLYFLPVKPIHKFYVKRIVRKMEHILIHQK